MNDQSPNLSVVRGSYSILQNEQDKLEALLKKFSKIAPALKKSEVIRIGIFIVDEMNESELKKNLNRIERLNVGRRSKENEICSSQEDEKAGELKLNNRQWRKIEKLFEVDTKNLGKPRKDYESVLNGLLYIFSENKQRRHLPESMPSYTTCWRRLREWRKEGSWTRISQILLDNVDKAKRNQLADVLLKIFLIETK